MTKTLLVATRNSGKASEIQEMLDDLGMQVVLPGEVGIDESFDVEEIGTTFEENALLKARGYMEKANILTLADDSGLVVDALGGRPGVYSKRYGANDDERIDKIIEELREVPEQKRTARFVSVMTLCFPNEEREPVVAKGIVEGHISLSRVGSLGFGYDPIFFSTDLQKSFGNATSDEKNSVSHRGRALRKLKVELASEQV